uniref:Uncharacterized protein n=1 Tax=Arundo donax TaxID=35708 RepID=A0A0A8YKF3_ARUDO
MYLPSCLISRMHNFTFSGTPFSAPFLLPH